MPVHAESQANRKVDLALRASWGVIELAVRAGESLGARLAAKSMGSAGL